MKVVLMPRGTGKTSSLINWVFQKENRILLVHNLAFAETLRQRYKTSQVQSFDQDIPPGSDIAIDEIGLFLRDFFPSHSVVQMISTSPEEEV